MDRVLEKITKLLKKKKLSIIRKDVVHTNEHLIFTDPVIILLDKNHKVNLAFHVASNPEFSAKLTLEFKKIEGVKDVSIGEVFILKKDSIITGADAFKEFDRQTYDGVVQSFIKEQIEDHMLRHGEAKNC